MDAGAALAMIVVFFLVFRTISLALHKRNIARRLLA